MVDALPFPEVVGLLKFWAGRKSRELSKAEKEALPSPNAVLPTPPPYVLEAMKKHKPELANARA
jgi:hypothetical protein